MKQTMKRGIALLLALMMCMAFVPVLFIGVSASEVTYVYDGKYLYNWGTREEVATFLSPNAEKFYEEHYSYEELAAHSGGTNKNNAPTSDLYFALQSLMKSTHKHITSYAETRDLYKYTDCENNGGSISSFYSGNPVGPAWDGGDTWNREHTWPNSKGLGGSDENDIMMLRPTASSENGARGNKAYGESSAYYYPNKESNDKHDVRGDVARIFLYVYVRWGNVDGNGQYDAWGSQGVIESVEVLLAWMEADPVDTWELGRNDAVEAITGTRNVFVDYPEFAFLLFGEEIPADMQTPSGNTDKKCDHNNFDAGVIVAATCTEKGYTLYTCKTAGCGYSYKTDSVAAKGHNYVGNNCSSCGEAKPVLPDQPQYVTDVTVGTAYKLGLYSTAKEAEYFFTGSMSGYYGATDTNYEKGVDVFAEEANGGYHLYFLNASNQKQYINLVASGTYRNFTYASSATSVFIWDAAKSAFYTTVSGEICYMGTFGTYVTMGVLRTSQLKDTDYIARFYTIGTPAGDQSCKHNNTALEGAKNATCAADGHTGKTVCQDCGSVVNEGQIIPALPHSFDEWRKINNPTCTEKGLERRDCDDCTHYETRSIDAWGHTDENGDKICDVCNGDTTVKQETTEHTCPEVSFLQKLWNAIMNFIRRLLDQPEVCVCGEVISKEN